MLQVLDQHWREHLAALDHLRQGIHLRGYAQKQPKQEYKREAFELFGTLIDRVRADVVRILMTVRIQSQEEIAAPSSASRKKRASRRGGTPQHAEFAAAWPKSRPTSSADAARARATTPRADVQALRRQDRSQRSVPLRLGQEVQAVPRQAELTPRSRRVNAMPVNLARPPDRTSCGPSPASRLGRTAAEAGIRKPGRKDLLVMRLAEGSAVAGVFTRTASALHRCLSARSTWRRHRAIRALVINTGNANAGTGGPGLADARQTCARLAALLGLAPNQVLPFSTGVIMEPLPVERLLAGLPQARATAARWLVRRGPRHHDHRHLAQGRVAPASSSTAGRSPSPASPRAPA